MLTLILKYMIRVFNSQLDQAKPTQQAQGWLLSCLFLCVNLTGPLGALIFDNTLILDVSKKGFLDELNI